MTNLILIALAVISAFALRRWWEHRRHEARLDAKAPHTLMPAMFFAGAEEEGRELNVAVDAAHLDLGDGDAAPALLLTCLGGGPNEDTLVETRYIQAARHTRQRVRSIQSALREDVVIRSIHETE
jgi:hypothetical protein